MIIESFSFYFWLETYDFCAVNISIKAGLYTLPYFYPKVFKYWDTLNH